MDLQVVDTNVLVAANGIDTHADPVCERRCAQRLRQIQIDNVLVLDSSWEILGEYQGHLASGPLDLPGNLFFSWAARVEPKVRVTLTPVDDNTFVEFPMNDGLMSFDINDRKFVAAASEASRTAPVQIVNAVDNDYSEHQTGLEEAGIRVDELCPQHLKATL